jgi:eukaryotic-like serine/threonine-protein kinase
MADDKNDSNIGLRLGNYLLREEIGRGGMASVYLAEHPEIGRKVAVKILNKAMLDRTSLCERFLTEAKTLARLRHPGIIEIYDYGRLESGQPYYVMEYLEGQEFGARLKDAGQLPLNDLLPIFEQLCQGLQAAHDAGVIHRDLKPPNIFIQEGKELSVKLIDFGIAKVFGSSVDDGELTQTGMVLGSPVTIAPEQVEGRKKDIGPATDIYALGVILYWALAGRPPFYGARAPMIMAMHVKDAPPPLNEVVEGLPKKLVDVIHRALAKKPRQRFQSPTKLYEALEESVRDLACQETIFPKTKTHVPSPVPRGTGPQAPVQRPQFDSGTANAEMLAALPDDLNVGGDALALKEITTTLNSALGEISSMREAARRRRTAWLAASGGIVCTGVVALLIVMSRGGPTPEIASSTITPAASLAGLVQETKTEKPELNKTFAVQIKATTPNVRCEIVLDGQALKGQDSPCSFQARNGASIELTLRAAGYLTRTIEWNVDSARTLTPELKKLAVDTTSLATTEAGKSQPVVRKKKARKRPRTRKKSKTSSERSSKGSTGEFPSLKPFPMRGKVR